MELRVVTDAQASLAAGIAPDRGGVLPTTREAVLLPLTMRERCLVAAVGDALALVSRLPDTPEVQAVWRTLLAGFATAAGVSYHAVPW